MDKNAVLEKLAARKPLFETIPTVAHKRIMGTESEYGVHTTLVKGDPVIASEQLPVMLHNGGEMYEDCGHVEYASPETAHAVAATAYYEAGKVLAWNARYSPTLFCNNNDWEGNTFGAHENYFTSLPRTRWHELVPFLIARTVLCGAGWCNREGNFEISQRAHTIQCGENNTTTAHRPLINLRNESLAKVPGFDRLHLICADANMSEVSTFLRLGTTACILEMCECGALPSVKYNAGYNDEHIIIDMKKVSRGEWWMQGVTQGPQGILDILALYQRRAQELLSHRDAVTDAVLIVWEDTLEKLGKEPMLLWRRLDWVAKLLLFRTFESEKGCAITGDLLRSQDLAYHNLDPAEGLYYYLVQTGEMERVVSDQCIIHAAHEPPSDTRAYARGKVVRYLEECGGNRVLCANSWDHLSIVDQAARGYPRVMRTQKPRCYISIPMPDPHNTYASIIAQVQKKCR